MKRLALSFGMAAVVASLHPARAEPAVSREFSGYNAPEPGVRVNAAVSREFSAYNAPPATVRANAAVSREFTAYNAPDAMIRANSAVSREFSLSNEPSIQANMAVSREFTGYLAPYSMGELVLALRVAAGFETVSPGSVPRLNVATTPPSTTLVDVLDAAAIAALQSVAPPSE